MNGDPYPDAFLVYKEGVSGRKIALMGSDGRDLSKTVLKDKLVSLLNKDGYYIEASHGVARAIKKRGVNPIDDKNVVKNVLDSKEITWLGDGKYSRYIKEIDTHVTKELFGKPRVE